MRGLSGSLDLKIEAVDARLGCRSFGEVVRLADLLSVLAFGPKSVLIHFETRHLNMFVDSALVGVVIDAAKAKA